MSCVYTVAVITRVLFNFNMNSNSFYADGDDNGITISLSDQKSKSKVTTINMMQNRGWAIIWIA